MSSAFVVPKKGEKQWRGVVDMRGPNSQTRRGSYPLPKLEDLLVTNGAGQMHFILELTKAFLQQPVHPDSRPLTCTSIPNSVVQ